MDKRALWATVYRVAELDTTEQLTHFSLSSTWEFDFFRAPKSELISDQTFSAKMKVDLKNKLDFLYKIAKN